MTRRYFFSLLSAVIVAPRAVQSIGIDLAPGPDYVRWIALDQIHVHKSRAVFDSIEWCALSERTVKRLDERRLWTHVEFDRSQR